MLQRNVMTPIEAPTQKSYREAVAKIIRAVQHEHNLDDDDFAEALGISIGTVRNARGGKADLNGATLAKIGYKYGVEQLDPYGALYGGRNVPTNPHAANDINTLSGISHLIATWLKVLEDGIRDHSETLTLDGEIRSLLPALNAVMAEADRVRSAA